MHAAAVGILAVLAGCAPAAGAGSAASATAAGASPGSTPIRAQIIPRVDHHQHLVGPTAVLPPPPSLPVAQLPAELDAVLQARNRLMGARDPGDLYTEDAQILDAWEEGHPWVRGRAEVARLIAIYSPRAILVPNAFTLGDSAASIAGDVRLADSPPRLNFSLGLRRGRDGAWRIAMEQVTPIPPRTFDVPLTVERLIRDLDDAGIQRAVVLSVAYFFGSPNRGWPGDEYTNVRTENDWTAAQVARYPDRLVAFCGIAPLREYAIRELQRCHGELGMRGIKMHFRSSRVDVMNAEHVQKVQAVFRAANELGMAIVVHSEQHGTYGPEHAQVFLDQILPAAPDVPVQIAHLWGGNQFRPGPLGVFADAVSAGDPRTRNLYFDLTEVEAVVGDSPEVLAEIAQRIRQIGLDRVLYGSDAPATPQGATPVLRWARLRRRLPLTDAEIQVIADNVAPYLRGPGPGTNRE